ncbi:MAG: hypothetical protein ACR2JB_08215 [Bryobacteraceae bacterium]
MVDDFIAGVEVALNLDEIPDRRAFMNVDPLSTAIVVADDEDPIWPDIFGLRLAFRQMAQ